jgi:hypothetical protein
MSTGFFEPGKRSHCLFTPELWCEPFKYGTPAGFVEFLCNLEPQTVGVILPAPPGEAGEIWNHVYERIAKVWAHRSRGFRCFRVDADGWTQPRPCDACAIARGAQVVIVDVNHGDLRAIGFREMARTAEAALEALHNLQAGQVPRKRVILIGCGPMELPPHYLQVYDCIDYANANGEPDLDLLSTRMQEVAGAMELFELAEPICFFKEELHPEPEEGAGPIDPAAALRSPDDLLAGDLAEELSDEDLVRVLDDLAATVRVKDPPQPARSSGEVLTEAEMLAASQAYAEAVRLLQGLGRFAAPREAHRLRQLAARCLANMNTREVAAAFFGAASPAGPSGLTLSAWGEGTFPRAVLSVGDGALRQQLGAAAVPMVARERLTAADVEELRREPGAGSEPPPRAAILVAAECGEEAGRLLADWPEGGVRWVEVRRADLQEEPIERPRAVDYLRGRLGERYDRAGDLFVRGTTGVVCGAGSFFGHFQLLAGLEERLRAGQSFGVVGLPRSGRSSLLCQLRLQAAENGHLLVLVDLQRLLSRQPADLYRHVAHAVRQEVQRRYPAGSYPAARYPGLDLDRLELFSLPAGEAAQGLRGRLSDDLIALSSGLRAHADLGFHRLVLLFDEIERILPDRARGADSPAWARDFLDDLRQLADREIAIGMAGLAALKRALATEECPLGGGRVELLPLGALSAAECGEMVRTIGRGMYEYFADDSLAAILRAGGRHPRLTKYLCSAILEARSVAHRLVRCDEVERGIQAFLRTPSLCAKLARTFETCVRCWPDAAQVLPRIAAGKETDEGVGAGWIGARSRLGTPLDALLADLASHGLIEPTGSDRFRISIGLLHDWLRQESGH